MTVWGGICNWLGSPYLKCCKVERIEKGKNWNDKVTKIVIRSIKNRIGVFHSIGEWRGRCQGGWKVAGKAILYSISDYGYLFSSVKKDGSSVGCNGWRCRSSVLFSSCHIDKEWCARRKIDNLEFSVKLEKTVKFKKVCVAKVEYWMLNR